VREFVCYAYFLSHDCVSSQYTPVRIGFKRLNFDHTLIIGWLLPTAMSPPKELQIEKTCGLPRLYDLACKNIQQNQRFKKQPLSYL